MDIAYSPAQNSHWCWFWGRPCPHLHVAGAIHFQIWSLKMSGSAILSSFRNRAIHFIINWDGTITKKDTLEFLGRIASQRWEKTKSLDSSTNDDPTTQMSWGAIVNAYMEDFTAHQNQYRPMKSNRKTILEERAWLASLKNVKLRSIKRVEKSRIFRGITAADIKQEANRAVK